MPAKHRTATVDSGPYAMLADPQADLFFTLVAVMLPAILLLLPAARMADGAPAQRTRAMTEALAKAGVRLDGTDARLFLARPEGIVYGTGGAQLARLDALPEEPALRGALAAARGEGRPVMLLIEPGAEEAAFGFEAAAAADGPQHVAQVRLAPGCTGLRGAAEAACPR